MAIASNLCTSFLCVDYAGLINSGSPSAASRECAVLPALGPLRECNPGRREAWLRRGSLVVRMGEDEGFEERLAMLKRGTGSGQGKKAEVRKARKEGRPPSATSATAKESVLIPPVLLKEPVSNGLAVQVGFTPYAERLNGNLSIIGLAALLAVELGSGESIASYHDSGTIATQVYFVLAIAALLIKYDKERISIWPQK